MRHYEIAHVTENTIKQESSLDHQIWLDKYFYINFGRLEFLINSDLFIFISQAPCTIAHSNISQPEYTYVELLGLQGFLDSESEPLSYVSEWC